MANKTINIGVAGLGRIGWGFHCKTILSKKKTYALVAVTDVSKERCKEAKEVIGCEAYAHYEDFLNHNGLEAVVIATPTHLHKTMAIAALKKGMHVILEKPMAANTKEAKAMLDVAKKKKVKFTVYQPVRLSAHFRQVLHILRSNILGQVYHVKINRFAFSRRNDWQSLQKFNGGMLSNYGGHLIDQLLHLIGTDIQKTFCTLRRVATLGDADDVVKIITQTKSGVIGEIHINNASVANPNQLEIIGTTGALTMSHSHEIVLKTFQKKTLPKKKLNATLMLKERNYPSDKLTTLDQRIQVSSKFQIDLYDNFFNSIRKNQPLAAQASEVYEVIKFTDHCRKEAGQIIDTRI